MVDRVRVVDAHPPREVVPAYRDVSAAVSDAERSLNQARADAAERHWSALAEAEAIRDAAKTRADRLVKPSARAKRRPSSPGSRPTRPRPRLTEFRLLWDTMATTLAGPSQADPRPRAAGRRHLWLADPDR